MVCLCATGMAGGQTALAVPFVVDGGSVHVLTGTIGLQGGGRSRNATLTQDAGASLAAEQLVSGRKFSRPVRGGKNAA